VKIAGSYVEHALVLAQFHGFAEFLADDLQGIADGGIIPVRPSTLLARVDCPMIDSRGVSRQSSVHELPFSPDLRAQS
jgi:hypothetical protein